jgi:hypothetical protein
MKPKSDLNNMKDLLYYEICAAWWPQFVSWAPLQDIIAGHFARKVVKKYRRWKWCVERSQRLSDLIPPNADVRRDDGKGLTPKWTRCPSSPPQTCSRSSLPNNQNAINEI